MRANIKIEAIGYGNRQVESMFRFPPRYWVAEMVYSDKRVFLKGKIDYSESNSKSTRGVYVNYIIESGKVYDVKSPTSWRSCDRYFATVNDDGTILRHTSFKDAKKATIKDCI